MYFGGSKSTATAARASAKWARRWLHTVWVRTLRLVLIRLSIVGACLGLPDRRGALRLGGLMRAVPAAQACQDRRARPTLPAPHSPAVLQAQAPPEAAYPAAR